jgi:hypothetical protein
MGLVESIKVFIESFSNTKGFEETAKAAQKTEAVLKALNNALLNKGVKGFKFTGDSLHKLGLTFNSEGQVVDLFSDKIVDVGEATKRAAKNVRTFRFEWLGVLFFGMQIQRMFGRIKDVSLDMYKKVMESSGMTTGAIFQFSAAWDYLKFTIGSAINTVLEPLLPYLLEIVNRITDWIDKNPKLAGSLIILGLVLGTLMSTVGQLALGYYSFKILSASMAGTSAAIGTGAMGSYTGTGLMGKLGGLGAMLQGIGKLIAAGFIINFVMSASAEAMSGDIRGAITEALGAIGVYGIVFGMPIVGVLALTLYLEAKFLMTPEGRTAADTIFATLGIPGAQERLTKDLTTTFETTAKKTADFGESISVTVTRKGGIIDSFNSTSTAVNNTSDSINNLVPDVTDTLIENVDLTTEAFDNQADAIAAATSEIEKYRNIASTVGNMSFSAGNIPSYQLGGKVEQTGLAYLHAGEEVIPKGGGVGNINVSVNIAGGISSDIDVKNLAQEVGNEIMRNITKYSSYATKY